MMRPRAIKATAGRSRPQYLATISMGLELLAEHVDALEGSAETANKRGAAAIRVLADEEAGKFLILIDAARCTDRDAAYKSRQLGRFNDHLSKGIYAQLVDMRPADFAEVLGVIQDLRKSHYLDGPNETDWIFRNEIAASREEQLYVDFSEDQSGKTMWLSPKRYDTLAASGPSAAVDLVRSMSRLGFTTQDGLEVVADTWAGFDPQPGTQWADIEVMANQTLAKLHSAGLSASGGAEDVARVVMSWPFPLHGVDTSIESVDLEVLRQRQANWSPW